MARFGTTSHTHGVEEEDVDFAPLHAPEPDSRRPKGGIWMRGFRGRSAALTTLALGWGLVNFGLLLWLPAALVERGIPMATASALIAKSALLAFPTVFVVAYFYSRWSTKGSLLTATGITGVGLAGVLAMDSLGLALPPVAILAFLIIGTNAMLAILLPYAAESYPLHIRGRATGWIAACTKGGGLAAQGLSIAALTPPLGLAAAMIGGPVVVGLALGLLYCRETRGVDLRTVDRVQG
jgi:putative MFS transporter